jgi:hypothetical protein
MSVGHAEFGLESHVFGVHSDSGTTPPRPHGDGGVAKPCPGSAAPYVYPPTAADDDANPDTNPDPESCRLCFYRRCDGLARIARPTRTWPQGGP